jgi:hypothetical protein
MGRVFTPARMPAAAAPEVTTLDYATGQTFIKGAVLAYEAGPTGKVVEAGANPAAIVGVALEAPASKPGFSVNFDSTVVARTGTVTKVSIAKANRMTVFSGRLVNGGTDPVTPALTDISAQYGITKSGAGEWYVDQAKTGANARVEVVAIDVDLKLVLFKFLEANLAQP